MCLLLLCVYVSQVAYAKKKKITLTPIEHIDSIMKVAPKPVLLLMGTAWCNFCVIEDHSIKTAIAKSENDTSFYYVYFDAERKDNITFGEQTYHYKASGVGSGVHALAASLADKHLPVYPTLFIWNKDFQLDFYREGLMTKQAIFNIVAELQKS